MLTSKVLQRIEDVTVMCEKHITNLRRLLVKPNRPIQSVSPEVVTNNARELAAEENQKEFNSCFSNGLAEKKVSHCGFFILSCFFDLT